MCLYSFSSVNRRLFRYRLFGLNYCIIWNNLILYQCVRFSIFLGYTRVIGRVLGSLSDIISGLTILVLIISTSSADESESEVSLSLGMSVIETLLSFSIGNLISSSSSSLCRINSKSTCSPTRLEYSGSTFLVY